MALDGISGVTYKDVTKYSQKSIDLGISGGSGTANMNISEVPDVVKGTGNNFTGKDQEKGQKEKAITDKQLKDAISKVNSQIKEHRTRCEFSYHEDTKRVSIKVIDKETEDVIREIPPEKTLEMVEKMWELAGFLVDEKR